MSHIKTQLIELIAHFNSARRVGHTTAMLNGALKTPGCLVLAADKTDGDYIESTIEPTDDVMVIGLPGLREGKLRGLHRPLVIDNHAQQKLLSDALSEIHRLEGKLEEVRRVTGRFVNDMKVIQP